MCSHGKQAESVHTTGDLDPSDASLSDRQQQRWAKLINISLAASVHGSERSGEEDAAARVADASRALKLRLAAYVSDRVAD
jgi:hypothetical protein